MSSFSSSFSSSLSSSFSFHISFTKPNRKFLKYAQHTRSKCFTCLSIIHILCRVFSYATHSNCLPALSTLLVEFINIFGCFCEAFFGVYFALLRLSYLQGFFINFKKLLFMCFLFGQTHTSTPTHTHTCKAHRLDLQSSALVCCPSLPSPFHVTTFSACFRIHALSCTCL